MLKSYSLFQIEQLKRNAKRLAFRSSLPHSNALDQIAISEGFLNWSQLKKRSNFPFVQPASASQARYPFELDRAPEVMYQAMRKARPNSGSGSGAAGLRLRVTDLSEQFISADNAIDFAIDYMESALSAPRYSVNIQSLAYYEMRCWLPYCVHVVKGNLRILTGRDYKPVGMVQKEDWIEYAAFPHIQLRISDVHLQRLLTVHRDDAEEAYLYEVGPWTSRVHAQKYLSKMKILRDWMTFKGGMVINKDSTLKPINEQVLDNFRVRHYVHGDQCESDLTQFYCAHCDSMVEAQHFEREHLGKGEKRYFQSFESWQRLAARDDVEVRRSSDAVNLLALSAMAQRVTREQERSPFHRWIVTQVGRNDPIGDLAQDIVTDQKFPNGLSSLFLLKSYLESKRAHKGALQALKTAWREFESFK